MLNIEDPSNFNILLFDFDIKIEDVQNTAKFVTEHCQSLYKHLMGVAKELNYSDLSDTNNHRNNHRNNQRNKSRQNTEEKEFESKSLCIAKSVGGKNGKPLLYWLFMLYLKERSTKYRDQIIDTKDGYDSNQWWSENKYSQWIQKKHPVIAEHIKGGLAELIKRLLLPINYHHTLFPVVCDRLNDFVEYALAFHNVAHRIKLAMNNKVNEGKFEAAPVQIGMIYLELLYCFILI